ncbi:MAG TPA: hypothetical protein VFT22_30265 [Kofleriaceae bacterium]|nr:hypothetical protein [Kofleriaceae bacterium]
MGQHPEITMNQDDEILRQVLRGDQVAWMRLFSRHGPVVERIARTNRSMGSYRESEDDVRNVMTRVFERLRRDDYRALRTFYGWRDQNPNKTFPDWLTIVTVNVIRNYISAKLGARNKGGTSIKQLINTLADALPPDGGKLSTRPHITTKEAAQRILEFARDHLANDQFSVLAAWLAGTSFGDMVSEIQLTDAKTAERLLRAALARLRRQFVEHSY